MTNASSHPPFSGRNNNPPHRDATLLLRRVLRRLPLLVQVLLNLMVMIYITTNYLFSCTVSSSPNIHPAAGTTLNATDTDDAHPATALRLDDHTSPQPIANSKKKSILCTIALSEEAYLTEFIDYHLGIGFATIVVYDNSEWGTLVQWGDERNARWGTNSRMSREEYNDNTTTNQQLQKHQYQHEFYNTNSNNTKQSSSSSSPPAVIVIHSPGRGKQRQQYTDCVSRAQHGEFGRHIEYVALWDVDEFIVLKQQQPPPMPTNVHDDAATPIDMFIDHYLGRGDGNHSNSSNNASSLYINWSIFTPSGHIHYEPYPVTLRFMHRHPKLDPLGKSISRLHDINITSKFDPHLTPLKKGCDRIDTQYNVLTTHRNYHRPSNGAVLHHYRMKSYGEYIQKRKRGWPLPEGGDERRLNESVKEMEDVLGRYHEWRKRMTSSDSGGGVVATIATTIDHFDTTSVEEGRGKRINQQQASDDAAAVDSRGGDNDTSHNVLIPKEYVYDDSAWVWLKCVCPTYALYDELVARL
ncbi:hypothetical protein ACHAXH_001269 [Discostella pseudostelligera]